MRFSPNMNTDWDDITDDFHALASQLRSPVAANRLRAAERLGHQGDPRAVTPLLLALKEADAEMRTAVMQALGRMGPTATEALCLLLQERKRPDGVRAEAASALGILGTADAIPSLVQALHDPSPAVRARACWALGRIASPEVYPLLIMRLTDSDGPVRQQATQALGQIGDVRAIPSLILMLRQGDDWTRPDACGALSHLTARHPVPELQAAVPILRRLSGRLPGDPKTHCYRELAAQIQDATDHIKDLPLPAATSASKDSLPLPAAPPALTRKTLPIPATERQGQSVVRRGFLRFWQRDRSA
jgi:HEAT repeat protein